MRKLSHGLVLLLALVGAFVLIDVSGCVGRNFDDTTSFQSQYGLVPLAAVTPFPTFDPALLPTLEPTLAPTAPAPSPSIPAAYTATPAVALTSTPTRTIPVIHTATPGISILSTFTPGALTTARAPAGTPTPNVQSQSDVNEINQAKSLDAQDSVFDALLSPFVNEALKRRAELAKTDPDYAKRVDAQLNQGRINFLLFGYGESHEPPATEKALIGSHSIISYNLKTREADIISLTHDIRAPEIERDFVKRGFKSPPIRLDQAYNVGGFKLMRQTLEDATGLSMDFQISFKDVVLQNLVDNVFAGVEVDVPLAFDVHPFYLEGKKYNGDHFAKGLQRLNGRQVIQFIKTVPVTEGAYDKSLEHNVRKALVFDVLLQSIDKSYTDRLFWVKSTTFLAGEMVSGAIAYDFDPVTLMINNIGTTTVNLRKTVGRNSGEGINLPKIRRSKYIVDPANGDGGVQWVNANAAINPITRKDIADGVYGSLDIEVPITANPYGDLPTDYWPSVRSLVKTTLTGP